MKHRAAPLIGFGLVASFLSLHSLTIVFSETGPIPSTFFGMSIHARDRNGFHFPTVPFGSLRLWDDEVNWINLERSKGRFNWSILDELVALAESHHVSVLYTFGTIPTWASSEPNLPQCAPGQPRAGCCFRAPGACAPPRNLQAVDDFVTALVTRYRGRIGAYELWNEPHNKFYWNGSAADLAILTQHAARAIRSIDPQALIVSPSGTPQFMEAYWASGQAPIVDVVALHGYPAAVGNAFPESIDSGAAHAFKSVVAKYHLQDKPLWDTEASWGVTVRWQMTDPDKQAAFVARHYLLHWSSGFTRYYWYNWDSTNLGTLWDPTNGENKGAMAYRQVYQWMVGATMPRPCSRNTGELYHALYSCELTRPGGYRALAVWNTDGTASFPVPREYRQYRDLAGHTSPLAGGSVTIGPLPLLLETGPPPALVT